MANSFEGVSNIGRRRNPVANINAGLPEKDSKNDKEEMSLMDEEARLEKEFEQTLFLDLKEENLEYIIVHPKENAEKMSNWVVFIGGFATTKEQYKGEILNLVRLGKTVVFVNPDKGITPTREEAEYFSKTEENIPSSIARKAAAASALLDYLNIIGQVDIIGNSQGAAVAVDLVGAHPEVAKRLVLDSPAGLIGKDSAIGIFHRATKDAIIQKGERTEHQHLVDPKLREYDADVWEKYYEKVRRHLPWRLTREVPDISKTNLLPVLSALKANRKMSGIGPEIILFNAYGDVMFPQDRIEKTLGDDPFQFIDRWAMYANKEKKHSKYTQPQPNLTPEEYFSSRDSAIHQLFSGDTE